MIRIDMCGAPVTLGKRSELFALASRLIGKGGIIASANPEILASASENAELSAAMNGALCIPDGVGVRIGARLFGERTDVYPGVELAEDILDVREVRLAIVGGKVGVAEKALKNLSQRHPKVDPVLALDGYSHTLSDIERQLSAADADVVFLCLGAPKQELYAKALFSKMPKTLFLCLGGSADVYSGEKKRCPKLLRRLSLEWAYRMICEPRRILRAPKIVGFFVKIVKITKKRAKIGKKSPKSE
jgi:N-acetylglucosaminyldiphosphoundecaprenol N-acetyl-beta-D-mannosaminyltransferase